MSCPYRTRPQIGQDLHLCVSRHCVAASRCLHLVVGCPVFESSIQRWKRWEWRKSHTLFGIHPRGRAHRKLCNSTKSCLQARSACTPSPQDRGGGIQLRSSRRSHWNHSRAADCWNELAGYSSQGRTGAGCPGRGCEFGAASIPLSLSTGSSRWFTFGAYLSYMIDSEAWAHTGQTIHFPEMAPARRGSVVGDFGSAHMRCINAASCRSRIAQNTGSRCVNHHNSRLGRSNPALFCKTHSLAWGCAGTGWIWSSSSWMALQGVCSTGSGIVTIARHLPQATAPGMPTQGLRGHALPRPEKNFLSEQFFPGDCWPKSWSVDFHCSARKLENFHLSVE